MEIKRLFLNVCAVCLFLICSVSCSNDEKVVKSKTNELFSLMNAQTIDSIFALYPDFDDSYMLIKSDSFIINNVVEAKNEDGYDVEITNYYTLDYLPDSIDKKKIILTFVKNLDGDYFIEKSRGLLNSDRMPADAIGTGYLKLRSNDIDVDVIKGLGILNSVKQEAKREKIEQNRKGIIIELWYHKQMGNAYNYFRVYNYTNETIKSLSFNCSYSYETLPGEVFYTNGVVNNIAVGSYRDTYFRESPKFAERVGNRWIFVSYYHLNSYEITNLEFLYDDVNYKGDEYANYLKRHPKEVAPIKSESKEDQFLSEFEEYVKKVEGIHSVDGINNMPKVNKQFSLKVDYKYGIKDADSGIEGAILKFTDEQEERYEQLKKRYKTAYQRLKDTYVKD